MTSTGYITLPITTDPDALSATALDTLIASIPGWVPQEGNLEVWLIEVFARLEAETRDVASAVSGEVFRYFGKSLINLAPVDAAKAQANSTWQVLDGAGYTIPAGTLIVFAPSSTSQEYFEVVTDVVIPPGATQTGNGEVLLQALNAGSAANGIPAGQPTLVDSLAYVVSVTTTTATTGGVDAESDAAYLDRLRDELKLLTPRPILPNDFAELAKRIPGVDRAIAIDGYNPSNGTFRNERMVTVALADANGNAVPQTVRSAVAKYLDSLREVNFVVNTVDPTYTTVDVTATVAPLPGVDTATLVTTVTNAVRDYLSPANWSWSPVVRVFELASLLDQVNGVDYVDSISAPASNVTLPGVAALVKPGAISISVLG